MLSCDIPGSRQAVGVRVRLVRIVVGGTLVAGWAGEWLVGGLEVMIGHVIKSDDKVDGAVGADRNVR